MLQSPFYNTITENITFRLDTSLKILNMRKKKSMVSINSDHVFN